MTAFAHKIRMRVYIDAVDANGDVYAAIPPINKEIDVEMTAPGVYRVKENSAAFAAVATGAITDGLTTPAIVVALSDKRVTFTPNTATPAGHFFCVADFDGNDTNVDSLDMLNALAADSNNNDANVHIFSAGGNT
jgi:hypothetical protein